MSLERQIRILFTVSALMFFYILWIALNNFFVTGGSLGYLHYLIDLFMIFLLQWLESRKKNGNLKLFLPWLLGAGSMYLLQRKSGYWFDFNFMINAAFLLLLLMVFTSLEREEIDYEKVKGRFIVCTMLLIILGLFMPIIRRNIAEGIVKYFVIFLVASVIALREMRLYHYEIRNKKSYFGNVLLAAIFILAPIKQVSLTVLNAVSFVYGGISDILFKILYFVLTPIVKFAERFRINNPEGAISQISVSLNAVREKSSTKAETLAVATSSNSLFPYIKIAILLVLLYLAYKRFLKGRGKSSQGKLALEIEREKIEKEDKPAFNPFTAMKKVFYKNTLREQILHIYERFEYRTYVKGIFKTFMTAKELQNESRPHIKEDEVVSSLTDIYNEAKFSNHLLSESEFERAKENYNKIKKHI